MVMSHKSNENRDKIVKIEAFYAVDRVEEKKIQAIHIWEDIVEKVVKRRSEKWSKVA